jgi:hypothetical protein
VCLSLIYFIFSSIRKSNLPMMLWGMLLGVSQIGRASFYQNVVVSTQGRGEKLFSYSGKVVSHYNWLLSSEKNTLFSFINQAFIQKVVPKKRNTDTPTGLVWFHIVFCFDGMNYEVKRIKEAFPLHGISIHESVYALGLVLVRFRICKVKMWKGLTS